MDVLVLVCSKSPVRGAENLEGELGPPTYIRIGRLLVYSFHNMRQL